MNSNILLFNGNTSHTNNDIDSGNMIAPLAPKINESKAFKDLLLKYAIRFDKLGFNVVPLAGKKPLTDWIKLQTERSIISSNNWTKKVTGIGAITGYNNFFAIDFDYNKETKEPVSIEFVQDVCKKLGLPDDYNWIVQTGSGKGFHVWVQCELPLNVEKRTRFIKPNEVYQKSFGHIELRFLGNTVLPFSLHESGNQYKFINCDFPTSEPVNIDYSTLAELEKEFTFQIEKNESKPLKEVIKLNNINHSSNDIVNYILLLANKKGHSFTAGNRHLFLTFVCPLLSKFGIDLDTQLTELNNACSLLDYKDHAEEVKRLFKKNVAQFDSEVCQIPKAYRELLNIDNYSARTSKITNTESTTYKLAVKHIANDEVLLKLLYLHILNNRFSSVIAPTGSGKSFAFINRIIPTLLANDKEEKLKAVFVVPLTALSEQLGRQYAIVQVSGKTNKHNIEQAFKSASIVSTIDALVDKLNDYVDSNTTLFIDEAHNLVTAYQYRKRVIDKLQSLMYCKAGRVVLITATPKPYAPEKFKEFKIEQDKTKKIIYRIDKKDNRTFQEEVCHFIRESFAIKIEGKPKKGRKTIPVTYEFSPEKLLFIKYDDKTAIQSIEKYLNTLGLNSENICTIYNKPKESHEEAEIDINLQALIAEGKINPNTRVVLHTAKIRDGVSIYDNREITLFYVDNLGENDKNPVVQQNDRVRDLEADRFKTYLLKSKKEAKEGQEKFNPDKYLQMLYIKAKADCSVMNYKNSIGRDIYSAASEKDTINTKNSFLDTGFLALKTDNGYIPNEAAIRYQVEEEIRANLTTDEFYKDLQESYSYIEVIPYEQETKPCRAVKKIRSEIQKIKQEHESVFFKLLNSDTKTVFEIIRNISVDKGLKSAINKIYEFDRNLSADAKDMYKANKETFAFSFVMVFAKRFVKLKNNLAMFGLSDSDCINILSKEGCENICNKSHALVMNELNVLVLRHIGLNHRELLSRTQIHDFNTLRDDVKKLDSVPDQFNRALTYQILNSSCRATDGEKLERRRKFLKQVQATELLNILLDYDIKELETGEALITIIRERTLEDFFAKYGIDYKEKIEHLNNAILAKKERKMQKNASCKIDEISCFF